MSGHLFLPQSTFVNLDGLPSNVHLLTLEVMDDQGNYLLRLENFMETGDAASVDLAVGAIQLVAKWGFTLHFSV